MAFRPRNPKLKTIQARPLLAGFAGLFWEVFKRLMALRHLLDAKAHTLENQRLRDQLTQKNIHYLSTLPKE
ncbi:hypothetical protein AFK76_09635 [Idiomarina zobellii]|uniref:Uncharacterized protein n=1 Tax=Idiomarina zobellii TaxID=86103 RepID=A0A837N7B7_9GAMM|nr:hypothetical protein AFK76_09635 [Idiomarina zobellii]SDG05256.1 hypothetical protein SAMN04515658_1118 [Idiomarina zobellii]